MAYGPTKNCEHDGCPKLLVIPDRWGTTDWFMQRDGVVWCPAHFPEWVEKWRAEKAAKKEAKETGDREALVLFTKKYIEKTNEDGVSADDQARGLVTALFELAELQKGRRR